MKKISTETPLEFDYFTMGEKQDTEFMRGVLNEYNKVGGLTCSYYPQLDADRDIDVVFLEKINKQWGYPIKVKFVPEYLEEVIENQNAGIMILDTLNLVCEKKYFIDTTKLSYPKIGDLVKVDYAGIMFEVTNVIDAEGIAFGQKFTWKITGKVYLETHEQQSITDEVHEPGSAPGETDNFEEEILDEIEEKSDEEYEYEDGDNPFGEH